LFLHHDIYPHIIHRDMKSSNILLTPFGVNKQECANEAKKQSRRRHQSDRSGVPVRPVS
jgi:serine/threonine protein kinase